MAQQLRRKGKLSRERERKQARFLTMELGRILIKKEMLENLASRPFVGLCATFASRKR
jgi:hypothetical protein